MVSPTVSAPSQTWKLSAVAAHGKDVRDICSILKSGGCFVTASRDKLARAWMPVGDGQCETCQVFSFHENFVSCVRYLPSHPLSQGQPCVLTGSLDRCIVLCSFSSGEKLAVFCGHEANVSCLGVCPGTAGDFVSGSWDSTIILWNGTDGSIRQRLTGHTSSILGLCVTGQEGNMSSIFSASGDQTIRRWSRQTTDAPFQCDAIYRHHSDSVRCIGETPLGFMISTSNDGTVVLFDANAPDSPPVSVITGHSSIVYSAHCILETKEILTVSEDGTLKVWIGSGSGLSFECIQTVHHGCTVWCVAELDNGNLVTGSSDGLARIFTKQEDMLAPPAMLESFEALQSAVNSALTSGAGSQGGGTLDPSKIEDRSVLQVPGSRDGQTTIVWCEGESHSMEVYTWNVLEQEWKKLGDVLPQSFGASSGGPPCRTTTGKKETYEGVEYDHIFHVNLNDEKTLVLPCNNGEDPWVVAERFIQKNATAGVGITDREAIVQFLRKNLTTNPSNSLRVEGVPASLDKPNSVAEPSHVVLNHSTAGGNHLSSPPKIKTTEPTRLYTITNFDGIQRKLALFLGQSDHALQSLTGVLMQSKEFSSEQCETFRATYEGLELEQRFPILDLFRHAALYMRSEELFRTVGGLVVRDVFSATSSNVQLMCLRSLANLAASHSTVAQDIALSALEDTEAGGAPQPAGVGRFSRLRKASTPTVREALASYALNAILLSERLGRVDLVLSLMQLLGDILVLESDVAIRRTALSAARHAICSSTTGRQVSQFAHEACLLEVLSLLCENADEPTAALARDVVGAMKCI